MAAVTGPRLTLDDIEAALARAPGATSDFDLNPSARPAARRPLTPASVLVPIRRRGSGLSLILTRRSARLPTHPGQISFPGGKRDPGDRSALDTALRESREEIGLASDLVRVLGSYGGHETVTHFAITPFVAAIAPDFRPVPEAGEVDEVFEVPLDFVLDPRNMQIHQRKWLGHWRGYYAVPFGPHYIWGATAAMLRALSRMVHAK